MDRSITVGADGRIGEFGLRERKKRELQSRLIDHALRLFCERGFDETTVEDIAAEADVSARTFFRYFRTKKDVVSIALLNLGDAMRRHVESARAGAAPIDVARDAVRAFAVQRQTIPNGFAQATMIVQSTELASRLARERQSWARAIASGLAPRIGGENAALEARVIAAGTISCLAAAFDTWIAERGARPLVELLEIAFELADKAHANRDDSSEEAA